MLACGEWARAVGRVVAADEGWGDAGLGATDASWAATGPATRAAASSANDATTRERFMIYSFHRGVV